MPVLKPDKDKIKYFTTQQSLRKWLEQNHLKADHLWIGFYKKSSGKKTISYDEALTEALCFGWIDGIRQANDEISYTTRFTPRRKGSIWSAVNIGKIKELIQSGIVADAGLKAFNALDPKKTNLYSSEHNNLELPSGYLKKFKANKTAWQWFSKMPNGYKRAAIWWIISAKQDATKEKRMNTLISDSEAGRKIKPLSY